MHCAVCRQKHDIDLSHVESRPAMDRDAGADYDFFVTVNGAFKRDALLKGPRCDVSNHAAPLFSARLPLPATV